MQTINPALNNQSQFSHNTTTVMTPTNQIVQPKQSIPNQQSRLIVVHHTLPWSFSPARPTPIELASNPAPAINCETRTHRLRARSISNLNPKGGSSIHCIRPSISNILLQENMNNQSWELRERSNHPALFAGEAQEIEKIFIGWPGHCLDSNGHEMDVPDDGTRRELESLYSEKAAIPVFIPKEIAHNAFNGYHSNMLWPLLHYAIKDVPLLDAMNQKILWEAFQKVNRLYLEVVSKVYRPGDCGKHCQFL
jgi:trehalose-6-phosphate synthase